jgi:CRP-like cAMP-binding protein
METLSILKATQLFKELDEEELDAVAKCVAELHYEPGEVVIQEKTPGQALYLVKQGKVKVEKETQGKHILLAELGPGQAFGEMSLIDSIPTSASVTAVDAADLLAIGRLDLNVLLNWNTILAAKMWRSFTEMLSIRLRDMNERLLERYGEEALQGE